MAAGRHPNKATTPTSAPRPACQRDTVPAFIPPLGAGPGPGAGDQSVCLSVDGPKITADNGQKAQSFTYDFVFTKDQREVPL